MSYHHNAFLFYYWYNYIHIWWYLSGFFSAIVYEVLYERVFGFSKAEITDTVTNVRHKKYNHVTVAAGNTRHLSISGNASSSGDEPDLPSAASSPSKQVTSCTWLKSSKLGHWHPRQKNFMPLMIIQNSLVVCYRRTGVKNRRQEKQTHILHLILSFPSE